MSCKKRGVFCRLRSCEHCLSKSFINNEKAQFWSSLNGNLDVFTVSRGSNKKYWFDCDICNHSFEISPDNINKGKWCPYCASKKLCDKYDCQVCFNKSFASHEKASYWSDKNDKKPRQIFKGSQKNYWFDCDVCNHSFYISLINIRNGWCSYCGNKKLCSDDCDLCYSKSFESHKKSKYWSKKNEKEPRQIYKHSNKKYWFNCNRCPNEFQIALNNVNSGNWCSICKNKTELKVYDFLKIFYPKIQHQVRFGWCKQKKRFPFDFLLESHKITIELDGEQHFEQVLNWKSPEHTVSHDNFKMECVIKNNYNMIRIPRIFVINDNWKYFLLSTIKYIINGSELKIIIPKQSKELYKKHKYINDYN